MSRLIDGDSLVALVMDTTVLTDGFKRTFVAIVNGEPTVEPRKGKWIEDSPLVKKCSKCGYHDFDWKTKNYNFCPNCGVDMRGENE